MIIQKGFEAHQVIAISQTAHAWVSGQLARKWGNECFPDFAPAEPLCYAAEQHDRGFLDWERQPTLNPMSGLPHTFENIPLSLHVELRKRSILELKAVSLYAALVTSLYFTRAVGKQSPPRKSRRSSENRRIPPRTKCTTTRSPRFSSQ